MHDNTADERFMRRALELAAECAEADEVPVGAVVVLDGVIVAEGANRKERELNAVRHAEIVALESAAGKLGNWWLENCDVYVTLEPCPMCAGAMINARVRRLVFGAYDPKSGAAGSRVDLFKAGTFQPRHRGHGRGAPRGMRGSALGVFQEQTGKEEGRARKGQLAKRRVKTIKASDKSRVSQRPSVYAAGSFFGEAGREAKPRHKNLIFPPCAV